MSSAWVEQPPASEHARSCAIFSSGHDRDGRFHPVPCDCHLREES